MWVFILNIMRNGVRNVGGRVGVGCLLCQSKSREFVRKTMRLANILSSDEGGVSGDEEERFWF
jgi:hypothetical protein